MTYNGQPIPGIVRVNRVRSAFANEIYPERIEYYRPMGVLDIEPIMGYPGIIDENDLGDHFMTGEEISKKHIGQPCWFVTDGHHRTLSRVEEGYDWIRVEVDPSSFTNYNELKKWREANEPGAL